MEIVPETNKAKPIVAYVAKNPPPYPRHGSIPVVALAK